MQGRCQDNGKRWKRHVKDREKSWVRGGEEIQKRGEEVGRCGEDVWKREVMGKT